MKKRVPAALAAMLLLSLPALASPSEVAAPKGAKLLLAASAEGVQIYACEAKDRHFAWVFKAPEAALFNAEGRQIINHFGGPGWKAEDGSLVTGEVIGKSDAPVSGAIPWLLLRAKSHEGAGILAKAGFIRRIDTMAGSAPGSDCDAAEAGKEARMRYSATYEFYEAAD